MEAVKKTCFFGCSLESGAFFIAWLSLVLSGQQIGAEIAGFEYKLVEFSEDGLFNDVRQELKMGVLVCMLFFDVILLFGVTYRLQKFVLSWWLINVIGVILKMLYFCQHLDFAMTIEDNTKLGFYLGIFILVELISIYFLVVVHNYYWELVLENHELKISKINIVPQKNEKSTKIYIGV